MAEEPDAYKHSLQSYLRDGYRFPLARQKAFQDFTKEEGIASILEQPNNILGIEYLKALSRLNSSIQPFAISRIGSGYHETDLHKIYSSASAIRKTVSTTKNWNLFPDMFLIPPLLFKEIIRFVFLYF